MNLSFAISIFLVSAPAVRTETSIVGKPKKPMTRNRKANGKSRRFRSEQLRTRIHRIVPGGDIDNGLGSSLKDKNESQILNPQYVQPFCRRTFAVCNNVGENDCNQSRRASAVAAAAGIFNV